MPRALIGHCMAPLNRNEVVIAAGYSPDLDDYSDRMDIYNIEKAIWYTKPWARLQQGPRIDASCLALTIGTTTQIIISGGWSNLGVQASELLEESTLRWNFVGENSTSGLSHALPYALRSSVFIELDNVGKFIIMKS